MDYLREMNAFVDWLETNPLDAMTQVLWFHLMAINNKCNWPEWFAVANLTLQAKLGADKKTIIKQRNVLVQKQLIAYKNQGREAGRYKMLSVSARMGGNIPPNMPPNKGLTEDIGGNIPPQCPPTLEPILEPIREPNLVPLYKLNKTKTKLKDIYTIFQHWNTQQVCSHDKLTPRQQELIKARLDEGCPVEELLAAIDNYAAVVHGDQYYWTHKWRLEEFLLRGLDKFKTASDPRTNFLKDKSKAPAPAQGGADKYADYVNRDVAYDDL